MKLQDDYEFLQISPDAEPDTIHRVYRFLAGRLHPDNPTTGNAEEFFLLKHAYDVWSHPERRRIRCDSQKRGGRAGAAVHDD